MRYTLFISDVHLENARADITTCFLNFLSTQAPKADALYILGDLFEVWIGDDHNTPFHQTILSAIQTLAQTTPVYFMRGNRDFLIGKRFSKQTGCTLLEDPTVIALYGRRVLLSHGDMLCAEDSKHQKFRALTQNPKYNRYFLWLPLFVRAWIARKIRQKSRMHMSEISSEIMDVTQSAVIRFMQAQRADLLIHGHTHRPNIHTFTIDNAPATRIVLGDWHQKGSVLVYKENGEFGLETLEF